jgi:acyl homoserine lactone synthase
MDRVLKRSDNAPYGYLGETVPMGKVSALAALLDCTPERINNVRNFSGINHDVFLNDDDALALSEKKRAREQRTAGILSMNGHQHARPQISPANDIASYCDEQIKQAPTLEERKAALALKEALSGLQATPRHCNA